MAPLDYWLLLVAFAGGATGATIGGLSLFMLCGLSAMIGTVIYLTTGDAAILQTITWGPFLGPHVAFSGGAAAAAYAAKIGKLKSGRDIVTPLIKLKSPAILAVGGSFGVLGYLLFLALEWLPKIDGIAWINSIAATIVISGVITRLAFGSTGLFGIVRNGSRWKPGSESDAFPWQINPLRLLILSVVMSLAAGFIELAIPGSSIFVFGLTAVALVLFKFGLKVPVTHHIVLSAGLVVAVTGNIGLGLAAGIGVAFLAEFFAALFLIHADSHIDPPAFALVVVYSLYPFLKMVGVF